MTSVAGLVTWQAIFLIYLRFYKGAKRQGLDRKKDFPYVAPFQPWLSIYGFVSVLNANNNSMKIKRCKDVLIFICQSHRSSSGSF
jgi:amino acid permease